MYKTRCEKEIKGSASLAFYLFSPTRLINSIKHEHSYKIFNIFYFWLINIIQLWFGTQCFTKTIYICYFISYPSRLLHVEMCKNNKLLLSPEKSQSYKASIQCWAIIGPLAFRWRAGDLKGVSLAGRWRYLDPHHQLKNKSTKNRTSVFTNEYISGYKLLFLTL